MLQSLPRALHFFFFNENDTKNTGTGNPRGEKVA